MKKLKLFMENFDNVEGIISYSVEDEAGNRVARAQHKVNCLKTYHMTTMDFFLLAFLPKLMREGGDLEVKGPISEELNSKLGEMQGTLNFRNFLHEKVKIRSNSVIEDSSKQYMVKDVEFFDTVYYLNKENLDMTLSSVFNFYLT